MKKSNYGCGSILIFFLGMVVIMPFLPVIGIILGFAFIGFVIYKIIKKTNEDSRIKLYEQQRIQHENRIIQHNLECERLERIHTENERICAENLRREEDAQAKYEYEIKKYEDTIDRIIKEEENRDVCNTDFDNMDGLEFEDYCAALLLKNGFDSAEVTKASRDQGVDVLAIKDGIHYGVQCKCYSSDIGNKAVQEAYAGKSFYNCHVAVVLTNRFFTSSAIELATKNGVVLWDRNKLIELSKVFSNTGYSCVTDGYGYKEYTCNWTIADNSTQILSELERLDKKMDEFIIMAQKFIDIPASNSFRAHSKLCEYLEPYGDKLLCIDIGEWEYKWKYDAAYTKYLEVLRILKETPPPPEYMNW